MAKYAVLQSFYASSVWINFRLVLIHERSKERGIRCERCGKLITSTIDIIAHHKIELTPENVHDYSISLNPELVELICHDCHNEEHNRFGYRSCKKVYIIFGPPLAGKKTYVYQSMKRGDIIVDMDRLYSAICGLPYYDKPDCLLGNVRGIYNQLIDNVKTRYGKWNNAWIIGGYAEKHKRERLSEDLGAELVLCDASKEECLKRLDADEDRRYRKDEWSMYIEKWFNDYVP